MLPGCSRWSVIAPIKAIKKIVAIEIYSSCKKLGVLRSTMLLGIWNNALFDILHVIRSISYFTKRMMAVNL